MLTLNLPDNWAVWPTAIAQVLQDPYLEHPGKLAGLMDRTAKVRAATRLGSTHPFYLDHADDILAAANAGDSIKNTLEETRPEFRSGKVWQPSMAGIILLIALDWDTTGKQRVSLSKIYAEIASACQNRIAGAQHKKLSTAWSYHRPTAHLWATWLQFSQEFTEICHSRQRLLFWLAHAEALRRLGAGCRIPHSPKQPRLLDLEATWCLLPSDSLPEVKVQIPSSDAILELLSRMNTSD